MNLSLNIVSFDVPFPPNYGGIVDVFYKIKYLNSLGVKIHLHTFEYGKQEQNKLLDYCEEVYYYKRNNSFESFFSLLPFIVKTRASIKLTKNLNLNNFPILFEGIHTSYPLLRKDFGDRITIVRLHNIEHNYYKGLSKSETNFIKKIFFKIESLKLKFYEKNLNRASYLLPISPFEHTYFLSKFPKKTIYISAFHENENTKSLTGKGNFALYHGDLRVSDNIKSSYYLISIFSKIKYPLIIASNFKNDNLLKEIKKYKNIKFIEISKSKELVDLIKKAHINVLPTFQNTGIKLKLINALFNGRFCIVNEEMIKDNGLDSLCEIANFESIFIQKIKKLAQKEFTSKDVENRKKILKNFNNQRNAERIIELLK